MSSYDNNKKVVYCYETKERFESLADAINAKKLQRKNLIKCIDDPNRTAGSFHWCTSLDKFDGMTLSKGKTKTIYCYETKEKFDSIAAAQKKYNIKGIVNVLDKPNKSAGNYHWCTSLELFDESDLNIGVEKVIYCYETKEKFNSIAEAAKKYGVSLGYLSRIIDNPNNTAGSYHWCTSLELFDGCDLNEPGIARESIAIYCYETKEKFDSINQASKRYNMANSTSIQVALNDPNRTAGSYHWCTDLAIFDNIKDKLNIGSTIKKEIFCYETKEKFSSINNAALANNLANGGHIRIVLDDPKHTAAGYHWCTSLDIFNPDDLVYPDSGTSAQEKEIVEFIKSIYKCEVIENSRNISIISPYELDIYLPELKLAFEYNGNYWHSEQAGKDKNYHINKTNLCKAKGIQLIHIFEYQWISKTNVIKSMIMNKLNKNQIKLYARNCEIRRVSNLESKNFLEENHIQGFVYSDINIGLYCNNILVSIMTFGKSRFDKNVEYELLRYACLRSTNVIGGASKLLKYFENNFKPKSLISYADISYSNGNLYNTLGFDYISTSKPDYISIKNKIVYPRYQTMKHKLPKLLGEENFDINLTEQQNLDNNGFYRIWKCGNLKYLKEYNYNE